jgi:hypothetical protein
MANLQILTSEVTDAGVEMILSGLPGLATFVNNGAKMTAEGRAKLAAKPPPFQFQTN